VRSLLAPFGHGTWTAIVCATIWRQKGHELRIDAAVLGAFALAVALHALWDWQLLPGALGLAWYVTLGAVGIWVLRTILHRATSEQLGAVLALNPELAVATAGARAVACRSCGQPAPPGAHYCVRCGAALRL
jgi:RsiW-degrading membrane proteinase PrsW (M82 family)